MESGGIRTNRLRIYIAAPLSSGDLCDNINRATDCFHRLLKAGLAPFCPHWSAFADGCKVVNRESAHGTTVDEVVAVAHACPRDTTWIEWMELDIPWVSVADALLRLPGPSKGADAETRHAMKLGIPVFFTETALLQWKERQDEYAAGHYDSQKELESKAYKRLRTRANVLVSSDWASSADKKCSDCDGTGIVECYGEGRGGSNFESCHKCCGVTNTPLVDYCKYGCEDCGTDSK